MVSVEVLSALQGPRPKSAPVEISDGHGRRATHVVAHKPGVYEVFVGDESVGFVSAPSDTIFTSMDDGCGIPVLTARQADDMRRLRYNHLTTGGPQRP